MDLFAQPLFDADVDVREEQPGEIPRDVLEYEEHEPGEAYPEQHRGQRIVIHPVGYLVVVQLGKVILHPFGTPAVQYAHSVDDPSRFLVDLFGLAENEAQHRDQDIGGQERKKNGQYVEYDRSGYQFFEMPQILEKAQGVLHALLRYVSSVIIVS